MSKKYKGKICVYCATRESTCPDHIIAREFFLESQRTNLPKVPSCDECNNTKSTIEHYATTLFPFGSLHDSAKEMLKTVAPKRLDKNLKLKRDLKNKMGRIWLKSTSGLVLPTITLPIQGKKLVQLFSMIVRGLYWHNWKTILPRDYFVEIYTFNLRGLIYFQDNLLFKAPHNFIKKDLGGGVFNYSCTRGDEDMGISAWEMSFYKGIMIAGNSNWKIYFCGLTGPEEIRNSIGLHGEDKT